MTTRDEILGMAREAGFAAWPWLVAETADKLEAFFRLAQVAAYERAAVEAWLCYMNTCKTGNVRPAEHGKWLCADAIRALKEEK